VSRCEFLPATCRIRGEAFVEEVRRLEEAAGTRGHRMTKDLISFDDGAMIFPEGGATGLERQVSSVVATVETVTEEDF